MSAINDSPGAYQVTVFLKPYSGQLISSYPVDGSVFKKQIPLIQGKVVEGKDFKPSFWESRGVVQLFPQNTKFEILSVIARPTTPFQPELIRAKSSLAPTVPVQPPSPTETTEKDDNVSEPPSPTSINDGQCRYNLRSHQRNS